MKIIRCFFVWPLLLLYACNRQTADTNNNTTSPLQIQQPGQWMDTISFIAKTDTCAARVAAQIAYLKNEKLSGEYSFPKYLVRDSFSFTPANLDVSSSRSAKMFKTKITRGLQDSGINFSGHYTIVDVPMTGWGSNIWIVDRKTGKAYEFPYKSTYLRFTKNSNLIIMNDKESVLNALQQLYDYHDACTYLDAITGQMITDLRPYYFIWKNNKLQLLAGPGTPPFYNSFWKDYFGR